MKRTALTLVLGVILVPAVLSAKAEIQEIGISGISVAPSRVCVNKPVTLTVRGQGTCNKVEVVWEVVGNVPDLEILPAPRFPIKVQHTYGHTGNVTLKVRGGPGSNCSGNKQVPLKIQQCGGGSGGVLQDICELVNCGEQTPREVGPMRGKRLPRITAKLGTLQSGNPLLVLGSDFGTGLGKVVLRGGSGTRQLSINEWSPGGIGGQVPNDIESICPTGEIQVQTSEGAWSNIYLVSVPHVIKKLPRKDVSVDKCGTDGNYNWCNENYPGSGCGLGSPWSPSGYPNTSILGRHQNCWGAVGPDSGTDVYEINLKNGWVLESATFSSSVPPGEGSTDPPSGTLPARFNIGATVWRPRIKWRVSPADTVVYGLNIYIAGPACAPHNPGAAKSLVR